MKKHATRSRLRAFAIWRKLGYLPWKRAGKEKKKADRAFYKGAFDSIPFLNDDAKRTFTHLLLRPGYMIRDYIRGAHDRYLAPLTSLIIFYAFFALVSAVLQPVQQRNADPFKEIVSADNIEMEWTPDEEGSSGVKLLRNTLFLLQRGYTYLNLDRYPEAVKTRGETALAALEGTLRSQGIPLFIGQFFLLWLAMSLALKRFRLGMQATAAASAYILCQFSFFMLFAVLLTLGESTSISGLLMLLLLTLDYRQLLDVSWGKGVKLAVKTGIYFGLFFAGILLLISALALLFAWFRGV